MFTVELDLVYVFCLVVLIVWGCCFVWHICLCVAATAALFPLPRPLLLQSQQFIVAGMRWFGAMLWLDAMVYNIGYYQKGIWHWLLQQMRGGDYFQQVSDEILLGDYLRMCLGI